MSRTDLRRDFATVYLAFYGIVVALAAERLLGRIGELETVDRAALSQAVVVFFVAGVVWWVAVRWALTLPWRFGFFDVVSPLAMLAAFHFAIESIGRDPHRWLIGLGGISIAAGLIYGINVRRALGAAPYAALGRVAQPVSALAIAIGAATLLVGAFGSFSISANALLSANIVFAVSMTGFCLLEDRAWRRIDAGFDRPDPE